MSQVVDVARCRALVRAAFPEVPARQVHLLGAGWDSVAFAVDEALVFRFPKRAAVADTLLTEARLLPELAPVLPLPVPEVRYVSGPVGGFPWAFTGYPLLPGRPAAAMERRVPLEALASTLGRFLRALHDFPVERAVALGVLAFSVESWVERYRALYARSLPEVTRRLGPGKAARIDRVWLPSLQDRSLWRFTPTLTHGDLSAEHVLVAPDPWRVTGVIDFGDAMVADPALDYAGFPGPVGRAMAQGAGLTPDASFWERRALYVWAVPLHAVIAGLDLGREDLLEAGMASLAQLAQPSSPLAQDWERGRG